MADKLKPSLSGPRIERRKLARSASDPRWERMAAAMVIGGVFVLTFSSMLFGFAGFSMPLGIGILAMCAGAGLGMRIGSLTMPGGIAATCLSAVWTVTEGFSEHFGSLFFLVLLLLALHGL